MRGLSTARGPIGECGHVGALSQFDLDALVEFDTDDEAVDDSISNPARCTVDPGAVEGGWLSGHQEFGRAQRCLIESEGRSRWEGPLFSSASTPNIAVEVRHAVTVEGASVSANVCEHTVWCIGRDGESQSAPEVEREAV